MNESPAQLLELARQGKAWAAADLWRAIAAGTVDDDVALAWLRDVAVHVQAKVLNPQIPFNRRREQAITAIGLEGRLERDRAFVQAVLSVDRQSPGIPAAELAGLLHLVVDLPFKVRRPEQLTRAERDRLAAKINYIRRTRKK